MTQKCKISVKFSGRLPVYSITDAVSHSLANISFKSAFIKQYIHLKNKLNLVYTGMASYFMFITDLYYSRSNFTKSQGSGVGCVSEYRLTSHVG